MGDAAKIYGLEYSTKERSFKVKTERKFIGLKDLILDVLLSGVVMVIVAVLTPLLQPLGMLAASLLDIVISALVGGSIYVLMTTKAPRIGTYFIFMFMQALFMFISGTLTPAIILCIGGILCELSMIGGWGKKWRPLVPYTIHWLFFSFAATFQFFFMRGSMLQTYMGLGMDEATATAAIDSIAAIYCDPLNMLLFAVCAVGSSALGYFIGTKIFHKHFKAAGVA
jgi:energy-coupling factor transport system substrate-specific component